MPGESSDIYTEIEEMCLEIISEVGHIHRCEGATVQLCQYRCQNLLHETINNSLPWPHYVWGLSNITSSKERSTLDQLPLRTMANRGPLYHKHFNSESNPVLPENHSPQFLWHPEIYPPTGGIKRLDHAGCKGGTDWLKVNKYCRMCRRLRWLQFLHHFLSWRLQMQ